MKSASFMASLSIACGLYARHNGIDPLLSEARPWYGPWPGTCRLGTPPYRGTALGPADLGTPNHLLLNHSRAVGMAIDNRTAACTCSACAYRGSEGNRDSEDGGATWSRVQ
jgi:hypothetical protein